MLCFRNVSAVLLACAFACTGAATRERGSVDAGDTPPTADGGETPREDASTTEPDATTPPPPPPSTDPRSSANVYFVGHSLISHRDRFHDGAQTIPELVGRFAQSAGVGYDHFRHTTPGAPLSWNWNSVPDLRGELERNASAYDTMVLTEGIFLEGAYEYHQSPFYARRFFCTLANARPDAELFVYETWHHVYASDPDGDYPDPHVYDWADQLRQDRARWERIVDEAASGDTPRPGGGFYEGAGSCDARLDVHLIPAGTALLRLLERIDAGEDFGGLTRHTLIQNGYRNWPEEWPVSPDRAGSVDWRSRMSSLQTYHPAELDDIHHGAEMAYFVSLVVYATVYRRDPTGLPPANGVSADVAARMQALAWQVVANDPRSGVR